MEYLILLAIGLVAGFLGGLLGIGGAVVMIPALIWAFGENQHLYQAAAMICNCFVGTVSTLVHKKANSLVPAVLKWLIPAAVVGVITGVAISNASVFAHGKSYLLARILGVFMVYVIIYNCIRFFKRRGATQTVGIANNEYSVPTIILCGLLTGVPAGLLGIGGGVVCVPAQQFFLKMPLKTAISNSAATIALIAIFGAFYKNVTLYQHDIALSKSLLMAAIVIPGSIVGSALGSRLMHKLPTNVVRAVFILLAVLACYKLLTVTAGT